MRPHRRGQLAEAIAGVVLHNQVAARCNEVHQPLVIKRQPLIGIKCPHANHDRTKLAQGVSSGGAAKRLIA